MKYIVVILVSAISLSCQAQNYSTDSLLLKKKVDFDSLYFQLSYSKDYLDSIKIYEYNILRQVDIVVKKLRENISERSEEKKNLIRYLEEYQKSMPSLHLLSDVLKTSFGAIPTGKGKIAALFYLKRLKDEYFMLMAVLDNAYSNFFLSWED